MKVFLVTFFLLIGSSGKAAPELRPLPIDKIDLSSFIKQGSFSGGTAKAGALAPLSLLSFQKTQIDSGSERLAITLGDKGGLLLKEPGYFHVALDEGGTRLVIDLSQVQQSSIDQKDLQSVVRNSRLIRSAEIVMDPVDRSTNLTFLMKKPVIAKAAEEQKSFGKVIVDLREAR